MTGRFAEWPEEVAFTSRELAVVLAALDHLVEQADPGSHPWKAARRAQLVVWRKLWPELAEQYDDPAAQPEE